VGVKTLISLNTLNSLFPSYHFKSLNATRSGVVDTTYIVSNSKDTYILKKYERDILSKIDEDIRRLEELHTFDLMFLYVWTKIRAGFYTPSSKALLSSL